jgi:pyridoxine 5-phosphate synthase
LIVRQLAIALDSLCALREAAAAADAEVQPAAVLAGLAGADVIRLGVGEELRPVRERDVREARQAAREFELRMPPAQSLLKLALEVRPDRVVWAGEAPHGRPPTGALDARTLQTILPPLGRALREGGIAATAVVAPDLEAVKSVHAAGLTGVELYTGGIVDLPVAERAAALERFADAMRLAAKLRLSLSVGGGLGYRTLPLVIAASPAAERVTVGRACIARAILIGLDRAVRDLRTIVNG